MECNEEAEEKYKLALEVDPSDADLHSDYGKLLYEMGRDEEAEEQFKLAVVANPKHVNAHYNYGTILYEMGRDEKAEEQFKLALEFNPNDAATHYNYGNLLKRTGRNRDAEEQYKLAVKVDPHDATAHYNYGTFLSEIGRNEDAEKQFKLTFEDDPNYVNAHCNYGIVLKNMGRNEEAEEQFELALKADPNHVYTHHNFGKLLYILERYEEAEEHFKLALESDPNNVYYLYDYGLLLFSLEHIEESEEYFKRAIRLNPNIPDSHIAYSILLVFKELEEDAIEEMKEASRAFRENGDEVREHLILAWLYEKLADIYYMSTKYQESGQYAEMAGNEFIEASKQAGENFKRTSLTKGYTLKGRAEIRKLDMSDLQPPYNIKMSTKIMRGIYHASEYYKKAAEVSPEDYQICSACSLSMRCLSEMLDNMLLLFEHEPKKNLEIKNQVEKWREELANCEKIYTENEKGKNFIQSLYKLMVCLDNLARYKESTKLMEKITLEDCIEELIEISNRIEGPIQKIINDSATQIEKCKDKIIPYKGIETKLSSAINESQKLEPIQCVEPIVEINSSSEPKKSATLKWIYEYRRIVVISILFFILFGLFLISKNNFISPTLTKYIPTKDNSHIFVIGLAVLTFLFGPAIVPRVWAKFKRKD